MKRKISITLDENILRQIDKVSDTMGVNRSKYIELLLKKDFEEIPVLILAGGGLKIGDKDKSLVEYNNKKIIEHQIKYLKRHDFFNVNVATDSRLVEDFIRTKFKNVNVFYEKDKLGSGGALKHWGNQLGKEFLLMHGDVISGIDLKKLVEFHRDNKSSATLVLKTMYPYNKYGVVKLEGSKIIDFTEKPAKSNSYLCYIGIGVVSKKILEGLDDEGQYEHQLNKVTNKYGYIFEGFWKAFETKEDLEINLD